MSNPYQVVKDFESELARYTGAPYAVTTTSCTMALLLACRYCYFGELSTVTEIPKRTYVSVPQSIKLAGGEVQFRDEEWEGFYQLAPWPILDSARWFTSNLWNLIPKNKKFICVSFHWSKTLAIGQGGAILHNNPSADEWFRRARFDGRTEGVAPIDDTFNMIGYHAYMSPRDAAEGLSRLAVLPKHNNPLPNDDYPDLSTFEVFK
jgi:dTDP-4-amino-4,6-dideoxygalactose transaminase